VAFAVGTSGLHCQGSDATLLVGTNAPGFSSDAPAPDPSALTAQGIEAPDASAEGAQHSTFLSTLDEVSHACGSGLLTLAGDVSLDRYPYLQQVTADSALVLFTTKDVGPQPVLRVTSPGGE
jgi:hypothetical protein